MSLTSKEITAHLLSFNDQNAEQELERFFNDIRYFVAPHPASPNFLQTQIGYYRGRVVYPGKKANKYVMQPLAQSISADYALYSLGLVFADFNVSGMADERMKQGIVEVMTEDEADEYERTVLQQRGYNETTINNALFSGRIHNMQKTAPVFGQMVTT